MKTIFFSNAIGEEGPGFVYSQIRQALEEAGVLYKHKTLSHNEYDREATKELEKCDLLVYDGNLLLSLRKAKKMGIKLMCLGFSAQVTYRERILDDILFHYGVNIKSKYQKKGEKAEKYVDYFLCLSEFVKYTYVLHGVKSNRLFVVPLGVDADMFSFAEQPSNFNVLFVGTNPLRKGLPLLLEAWKELNIKGKLIIRSGINLPPTENVICIPNWTSQADLVRLYHSCSLTILPSLEDGFAATILESMSCGKPIIATNATGAPDVITDYKEGILISPNNVKEIKEAIMYFYDNPKELVRMGKEARKTAEKYSWERFREGVVKVVENLF